MPVANRLHPMEVSVGVPAESRQARPSIVDLTVQQRRGRWRKVAVIGGIAVVVVTIAAVLLALYVGRRPGTLQLPQTFSAQFTMSPDAQSPNAQSVSGAMHKTTRADGTWALTGKVSITAHGQTTQVVLAEDGAAYFQVLDDANNIISQGCMQQEDIPMLDTLQDALDSASVIDASSYQGTFPSDCVTAKGWVFNFQGLDMLVCTTSDGSYQLSAAGVSGVFTDIQTTVSPSSPFAPLVNATSGQPLQCPALVGAGATTNGRSLEVLAANFAASIAFPPRYYTMTIDGTTIRYYYRRLGMGPDFYSSVAGFNLCLFVHGAGVTTTTPGLANTFTSYWGDVQSRVLCAQKKFLIMDTVNNAWDSPVLAQQFCDAASSASLLAGTIMNVALFTHGSGSLIAANAIVSGKCSLYASKTMWLEVQASYNTGVITAFANSFCPYYPFVSSAQLALQGDLKLCSGNHAALGWRSLMPSYVPTGVTWAQVSNLIKSNVNGAMCGSYPAGLAGSSYFAAITSSTDVDVSMFTSQSASYLWSTCWDPAYAARFETSPSAFYKASVNYMDVTCRNGDGFYGVDRLPCTWYNIMSS